MSCMHTAFILQEAVRSLRVQKKKAYVAFLDVRKAFDTVWHSGLLLKLIQFQVPKYIWSIINNWYHHCAALPVLSQSNRECAKELYCLPCSTVYL